MQFTLLMVAAAIAMVGAIFHGYVGGRLYMKNIRESQLASLTQSLSLVSWQMFTVLLMVTAITLTVVAWQPHLALMAVPLIWANAVGACLFLVLSLMGHSALIKLPGLYLMGLTALLSGLGVAAT
jgi:LytS/YehU family sensor histidine kinase